MAKKTKRHRSLRTGSIIRKGDEWLAFDRRWHKALASFVGTKIGPNQVYRRPL